jgi:hypothetical protein
MSRNTRSLALLTTATLLTGCYQGFEDSQAGESTSADAGSIPAPAQIVPLYGGLDAVYLEVTINGNGPFVMRYDTGSPSTILDDDVAQAAGVDSGRAVLELAGQSIGSRPVHVYDLAAADQRNRRVPGEKVHGLIGNDAFAGYSVGLNLAALELWLTPSKPPEMGLPHPEDVGQVEWQDFDMPLGYLAMDCAMAANGAAQECLFDTGAPEPLALENYWSTLEHPSDRKIPRVTKDFRGMPLRGYVQRAQAIRFGELSIPGPPVLVFEHFETLEYVFEEIGRPMVGLIGLAAVREHFVTIDYDNRRMAFWAYLDRSHLPKHEFFGFGIVFDWQDPDLIIAATVEASQAQALGLMEQDILLEADGIPWSLRSDINWTAGGFLPGAPGETHNFTFARGHQSVDFDLAAEDLLPEL